MENIGGILKKNRKDQGKTLEEVNEKTKISLEHLKLLEKNDYTFLPETYVKSFIKHYALALGLDGDDLVDRYAQNQEEKKKHKEEHEKEVEIETRPSSSKQKAIEWALGVGSLVLLISLILVYFQYKSQIHAPPAEPLQNFIKRENALAEIVLQEAGSMQNGHAGSPLELEIRVKEKVWLRLTIDNQPQSEYKLSPTQNKKWTAVNRFEIVIGKMTTDYQASSFDESNRGSQNEKVHLTFTRAAFTKPNK